MDIQAGQEKNMAKFMSQYCFEITRGCDIKFNLYEKALKYATGRGSGISFVSHEWEEVATQLLEMGDQLEGLEGLAETHPQWEIEAGTVGCFVQMESVVNEPGIVFGATGGKVEETAILTAQHIIEGTLTCINDDNGEGEGFVFCDNVASQNDSGFSTKLVAKKTYGFLGPYTKDQAWHVQHRAEEVAVDVAYIPIRVLDVATRNAIVPFVFFGNTANLLDKIVEKVGFKTNHTFGEVISTNYTAEYNGKPGPRCLLVARKRVDGDRLSQFSQSTDSGSLIIHKKSDTHIQAIGILSKNVPNYPGHGDVAVIVLLKNCFEALQHKYGKLLKLDRNWEWCEVDSLNN